MKILNTKFGRQAIAAALILSAMASMSLGAFAAEPSAETAADEAVVAGYLPPQEQMVQGDIALHSGDVAVGEKDPSYGGYGAPEGNPIQGNIMLISGDELADTAKTEARYTVKGLLGKQLLYTARRGSYLPHHHQGHAGPAGQRRKNAGAGDREEHHHSEPLAAVRGTEVRHPRHPAASGQQCYPLCGSALPPRPADRPLSKTV